MAEVGKAWQRLMRERIAAQEAAAGPAYWQDYGRDIAASVVRPVETRLARSVIEEYEWLGKMPAIVICSYGLYFGDKLGGVAVYSPDYGENLGIWDRYGYTGKIILLARGACVHWAHPHSASRLIRGSMRLLPSRYEVVTATVDANAGEVGTIYQAAGFDYTGPLRKVGDTSAYVNGTRYTQRGLQHAFGTKSIRKLKATFGDASVVPFREDPKARYFAFLGSARVRRANRKAIASLTKPYPRRNPEAPAAAPYDTGDIAA
jgi:hypothetical protein